MPEEPTIDSIKRAAGLIAPHIHRTPVLTSRALNKMTGAGLFFKCENFQKAGVFKFRGATNAILNLKEEDASSGVATHSSGNHGAALALAARLINVTCYVVMPENAPKVKKDAVDGYGAQIIFCEPTLASRESTLKEILARTGATLIHPYDNCDVIAGQGTAALELCEDTRHLDIVMAPVGGGGLLSGTSIAVSGVSPTTIVIAAEPQRADDAYRSFHAGKLIPVEKPDTIADGLRTSLSPLTFSIIRKHVFDVLTVSEEAIVAAMRYTWERMKIVIEPSAAVPLAAVLSNRGQFTGKRVGIIVSGGNVDLDNLPWSR